MFLSRAVSLRPVARSAAILIGLALPSGAAPVRAQQSPSTLVCYLGVGDSAELAHVPGFIRPDGTDERYPDFRQPGQKSWVFGPQFADGRRILASSYQDTDLQTVRSGKAVTRDWIYHIETGKIEPALARDRPADHMRPCAMLPGDRRVVETAVVDAEQRVFIRDLDGANSQELTTAGEGFHYGLELSHDGTRLACHVTGGKPSFHNPGMYSINVLELETRRRMLIAGQPEHLLFGPRWSPDDKWLAYLDCHAAQDPLHFRAALAIGRADGSEHQVVTPGQTHWFGTPFGSNMTEWSPDGRTITYTRLQENSQKDMSAGGSQVCLLNPWTGATTELTRAAEGIWDYRAAWSPDGTQILFTRARKDAPRELWIMHADGSNARRLTDGYQHRGADFGRWLRVAPE